MIGRLISFLAVLQDSVTWRLGCDWDWSPLEVLEALAVLRHVDARWE